MKQVLQNLKSGAIEVAEVPCPMVRAGHLLIQTRASLISAGTERMLVEFGKGSLLAKARSQPDKVKQVLDKIRTDGLMPTLEAVFSRLDEPMPLGYCNAGVVLEVGAGVEGFKPGDRVVSNGAHAEVVCVPKNLCARIPDGVDDDAAAFTVLGAIALQGIRLCNPTIGETIVVTGLGLIGLMAVQMLLANGCRVIGIDIDPNRLALAAKLGAMTVNPASSDPAAAVTALAEGRGADGVIITASAKTNDIMKQAAQMSRKRGRIILIGVVGLELSRADFYKKELSFQVSCSYGPGRYDANYEERGQDYPAAFVRWTEQRNFQAILELMASRRLDVAPLISKRIAHGSAQEGYSALTHEREALGLVLKYPNAGVAMSRVVPLAGAVASVPAAGRAVVGLIGAGNFAKMTLLPALKGLPVELRTIVSAGGVTSLHNGRRFGFAQAATDHREIINDPAINTVIIVTRHNLHAAMTLEALAAGKHVAVEKPLCLNARELDQIIAAQKSSGRQLLVGFNRRFSPHAVKMKSLLAGRSQPMCLTATINAGVIPPESWTQDALVGGGRIIGEGCHWIDLMRYLTGAPITTVVATRIGEAPGVAVRDDKMTVTLTFADGSIGTLHYFGNGDKGYPKETIEVFGDGRVLRLDNFRLLTGYGWPSFRKLKTRRIDKGHGEEFRQFVQSVVNGGPPVMPMGEIENVTRATFAAVESAHSGQPVQL